MSAVAAKTQPSLAEQFIALYNAMAVVRERLTEQEVDYLKSCHPSLPRVTLEMDLFKHRSCRCAVALEIASKKS